MDAVSNKFYAYLIKDGKSVSAILRCNTTLSQTVFASGPCSPNWNANEQGHDETPIIWAQCRLSGKPKAPSSDFSWKWNGSAITFDSTTGKSNGAYVQVVNGTTYPIFEKTTVAEGGVNMPGLKILRNLASFEQNTDNDLITLDGAIECAGVPLGFSISKPIRIQESSGTGWDGWVTGVPRVTEESPSTTLSARLKNGPDSQQTFTAKFFREGIDTSSPLFTVNASAGVAQATFTTSHITDNVVVRVEFYVDNMLRDIVYFEIDDETDIMELQVTARTYSVEGQNRTKMGSGQNDVFIRESQEVLFTFYMGHRMHPERIYSGYTKFYVKLINNEGTVLSPASYKSSVVIDQTKGTRPSDANFQECTVSLTASGTDPDPVTGPGGKATLSAEFLGDNGDGVGGVVVAE